MNPAALAFYRTQLKEGLAQLTDDNRRIFKLMYARSSGRRSVEDAAAMPIDAVVDAMPEDILDWALTQVQRTVAKAEGR
jgi:hypothetical protein